MKKYIILLAVTVGIIGGMLIFPEVAEAKVPEVQVVTMQDLPYTETLTVSGTVEEIRKKELTLQYPVVPGEILAEVGDTVTYGDVLATVDTEATKQAILSYAAQYSDSLPEDLIPDQLQTVLAAVDGDQVFEALELPTEILAPASGTITSLSLHQGELFLPQTAAATISYMDSLQLRLSVPEKDISLISPGQQILFTATAIEGGTFAATVRRISPTAYQQLNGLSYETVVDVLATVEDDFDVLRPGYSVRAEIAYGEEEILHLFPYEAVLQDAAGQEYVYVYREGKAWRWDVETGVELSTSVAVTSGIGAYEKVILNAADVKADGAVKIRTGE